MSESVGWAFLNFERLVGSFLLCFRVLSWELVKFFTVDCLHEFAYGGW